MVKSQGHNDKGFNMQIPKVTMQHTNGFNRLDYCPTPYQRLHFVRPHNGAPFSRLLRHAGDTEDVFSA